MENKLTAEPLEKNRIRFKFNAFYFHSFPRKIAYIDMYIYKYTSTERV